jgi:hypothetical protein
MRVKVASVTRHQTGDAEQSCRCEDDRCPRPPAKGRLPFRVRDEPERPIDAYGLTPSIAIPSCGLNTSNGERNRHSRNTDETRGETFSMPKHDIYGQEGYEYPERKQMSSLGGESAAREKNRIEQHRDDQVKDSGGGYDDALASVSEVERQANQGQ